MKFRSTALFAAFVLSACSFVHAQAPAGATGQCKDGSYSTAASKSGACSGHKGVKTWYSAAPAAGAKTAAAKPAAAPAAMPAKPATAAAAPMPAQASKPAAAMPMKKSSTAMQQAPGGGPGLVWLNTESKVYHCNGTHDYGTTKKGAYMTESDAKAKGGRPDAGKACSK